jgi:hypothetical protein
MKLLRLRWPCDCVRDAGEVICQMSASQDRPFRLHGVFVLKDELALDWVRQFAEPYIDFICAKMHILPRCALWRTPRWSGCPS